MKAACRIVFLFAVVITMLGADYIRGQGADDFRKVAAECEKNRPEAFRGLPNLESVRKENQLADRLDLSRIKDNKMLRQFILEGYLVPVQSETKTYFVDILNKNRYAFTRPWVKQFLDDTGGELLAEHQASLKVAGLMRTVQGLRRRLWKTPADCRIPELCSSHTTGAAVDISKQNLTITQIVWLRMRLLELQEKGVVLVIEECGGNHFHIMVLPTYLGAD